MLFFAYNVNQIFEELEAKWCVVKQPVKVTHSLLYQQLGHILMIKYSAISVMAGLIIMKMLFFVIFCL